MTHMHIAKWNTTGQFKQHLWRHMLSRLQHYLCIEWLSRAATLNMLHIYSTWLASLFFFVLLQTKPVTIFSILTHRLFHGATLALSRMGWLADMVYDLWLQRHLCYYGTGVSIRRCSEGGGSWLEKPHPLNTEVGSVTQSAENDRPPPLAKARSPHAPRVSVLWLCSMLY